MLKYVQQTNPKRTEDFTSCTGSGACHFVQAKSVKHMAATKKYNKIQNNKLCLNGLGLRILILATKTLVWPWPKRLEYLAKEHGNI